MSGHGVLLDLTTIHRFLFREKKHGEKNMGRFNQIDPVLVGAKLRIESRKVGSVGAING
jgi:hypothetical protein